MKSIAGSSESSRPGCPAVHPGRFGQALNLQAWPGRQGVDERPTRRDPETRLGDRSGIVLVAAAERGANAAGGLPAERFGLGAYLVFSDRSVTEAGLVAPDGRPEVVEALREWCAKRRFATVAGPSGWRLRTLSEFFDYRSGIFTRRVYVGAGWLVTADVGRTLGLCSEDAVPARGNVFADGFTLHFPTWTTTESLQGRIHRRPRAHRPALQVKAIGSHGYLALFARASGGAGAGKRNKEAKSYRGRVLDVVSVGDVFDGADSAELADHLESFGLERTELPVAVSLDAEGADAMAAAAEAVFALALRLDDEAARWFTSSRDRSHGYGRVDLSALRSAGGLAAQVVRKSGVRAPLLKFKTPDDYALDRWIGAHRGGWLSAELAGAGLFPAVDIDAHSAYPAVAALLGWWEVMIAAQLRRKDVHVEVQELCAEAAGGDIARLLRRETWDRLGFALCEVIPDGESWPVESPDEDYPEGHAGMRPVRSSVALPFTWPDVVLAALRSGRVPRVISAERLIPVGRQALLQKSWTLYGGRTLYLGQDPAVALVRRRDKARVRGDKRLVAMLRVLVNSLVYGNAARLDPVRRREQGRTLLYEQAFEFSFPPIAATVTAGTRLVVGVAEHLVEHQGGTVASRDTDGLLVVSSPEGGTVSLFDGLEVGAISWAKLKCVLARFNALDPWRDGAPFWKAPRREHNGRPLEGLVIGVKRYVLATLGEGGDLGEVVDATEHALGGSVVDPPGCTGRAGDGRHRWTREIAAVAVRQAIARARGERLVSLSWPWESDGAFPAVERCQVASAARLAGLSNRLSLKPFGRYVSGVPEQRRDFAPVALDPGGDLSDWRKIDWRGAEGEPVETTVDPSKAAERSDRRAPVLLANLGGKAIRWLRPRPVDDRSSVVVEPELIRRVGRSGALIEARLTDPYADTSGLRCVYSEGDPVSYLVNQASKLGPRAFARMSGISREAALRLANGKPVQAATIRKTLANLRIVTSDTHRCQVCQEPVFRIGALYCSPRCRETDKKRRQRAGSRFRPRVSGPSEDLRELIGLPAEMGSP
jgi:hypothetical protein